MKGMICLALATVLIVLSLFYFGYPSTDALQLGLGIDSAYGTVSSANGDENGKGQLVLTVAAVLLDTSGRIVKCRLDTADSEVAYQSNGAYLPATEFKTKYEKGAAYGMVAWGGAEKEWFEQADAFASVCAGKTLTEVQALVAEGGRGSADVITAGCTIAVADFVRAIEKAVANAAPSNATAADTLALGIVTEMAGQNASESGNGSCKLDTTIVAAAVNAAGNTVAMTADCVSTSFGFTIAGAATTDTAATIKSKRELGFDYGMVNYGASDKEWFEQADAFALTCLGKNASGIAALVLDTGYGNDSLVQAGCTITVSGLARAAQKATATA